jgi:hypothetical protein
MRWDIVDILSCADYADRQFMGFAHRPLRTGSLPGWNRAKTAAKIT